MTNPFKKKEGSRRSVFEEEELAYLTLLRQPTFKLTEWRIAKVQLTTTFKLNVTITPSRTNMSNVT